MDLSERTEFCQSLLYFFESFVPTIVKLFVVKKDIGLKNHHKNLGD